VRVRIRLFARYREATGQERMDVDLPEGSSVDTAWKAIVDRHPDLARYRPYTLFAVGHDYVEPDHPLKPDDELCLFPPVSGGSGSASRAGASGEASGEMIENSVC
jgi:molybdopterin converting factor subunit 1